MSGASGGRRFFDYCLTIVRGLGWVYACCVMGMQCNQDWAIATTDGWAMVGRGLPIVFAGAVVAIIGVMALKRIARGQICLLGGVISLVGILKILIGLWGILVCCVSGVRQHEGWAFLTFIGWLMALYGTIRILSTDFSA